MDTNLPNQTRQDNPTVPAIPRRSEPGLKPKPSVETRVLQQDRDLLLVEWHDGRKLRRAWVTADMVEAKTDNAATVLSPGEGIPYGMEWSRLIELTTTPAAIEQELHRLGIWTLADLRSNPQQVVAAIQAAYGFARGQLLQAAERYEEKLKEKEE